MSVFPKAREAMIGPPKHRIANPVSGGNRLTILKKVGLLTAALLLLAPAARTAAQPDPPTSQPASPKVAVLPFAVFGPGQGGRLGPGLQDLMIRQLEEEGLAVLSSEQLQRAVGTPGAVTSDAQARALGRRAGVQFVITGTLSQVGEQISADARVVDVSGNKPTRPLYSEQRGTENLATAGQELVQQALVHLLAKAVIAEVKVRGNDRIEVDAILVAVESKKGDVLRPKTVQEDIKKIYQMGYFEAVNADVSDGPNGKILTFEVREQPSVIEVKITGNKKIKEKDILAAITTKAFTVLQKNVVNDDVQRILGLYHEKAYFNAVVDSAITFPKDPRQATVAFTIEENKRIYIKDIRFSGNKKISSWRLRMVMETKERGVLSWFTDRGVLKDDVINTDIERITAFYHDRGYMSAKVSSPQIDRQDDGFTIDIVIDEGQRFKVESVGISGELLEANDEIIKKLALKPGHYFSRDNLRKDIDTVTTAYMDQGFAQTQIDPKITQNQENATTTIVFQATQGPKMRIEGISITGNTKTRDKVIRREMKLTEGDQFNSSKLQRSHLNLRKLDYFEEVEIVPEPGSDEQSMKLHIKVKEKPTGAISFGGGYSSDDGPFAVGEIIQRNLFGRGQYLGVKAYLGGKNTQYRASFVEPYFLDTQYFAGIDLYDWYREYTDFTKDAIGTKLKIGHPFGDWSRWTLYYGYEDALVKDVNDDASVLIKDQEGRQILSAVSGKVERDSTDHPFIPTSGSINEFTIEYSTPYLGSDSDYVKFIVNSGWYYPLFWKFIGFARVKAGYIEELDSEYPIPIFERFFLGGMNSLRGWGWGEVGPKDPATGDVIGGTSFGLVNLELQFPLIEKIAMLGVIFYDTGNAFDDGESFDVSSFRSDAGVGIRWNSPLGPLRIEYGHKLDPDDDESSGKWQFSMGAMF